MPRKKKPDDIVDGVKKTVSKAKRDVSVIKKSLPNAMAENAASDKGTSTVAKNKPRKTASESNTEPADVVKGAVKKLSKAKRDVSAIEKPLSDAVAGNATSGKGAGTVAQSRPRKTASQAKSKAVDTVEGIRKKVSKAKNDVVSQENPTPNAVAETATFDQGAGAVLRRRPRKLVSKAETASFTGSQPMGLLSADDVSVGPPTAELKEKFGAQKIPLQTDFAELIDVADCGRKAAGLSPEQPGGAGAGLLLDAEERLAVHAGMGISVDPTGVSIDSTQLFVKGMIIMFSGSVAPAGWAFCDGVDGRPNLMNRFILGGSGSEVGTSGGAGLTGAGTSKSYSVNTNTVSAGTITVTVASTVLTAAQMPNHYHNGGTRFRYDTGNNYNSVCQYGLSNLGYVSSAVNWGGTPNGYGGAVALTSTAGGGQGHTHANSTATQGTHSHTVTTLPAYYILAFIIKL